MFSEEVQMQRKKSIDVKSHNTECVFEIGNQYWDYSTDAGREERSSKGTEVN